MTLNDLIDMLARSTPVRVRTDSREVRPGDIFVAIAGSRVDGHDFIPQALKAGAGYIVAQRQYPAGSAELVVVEDSALAAGQLAQAQYGNPAGKLTSLAVTGTNGKTTVAFLSRAVLEKAGHRCGLMGTVLYHTGKRSFDAPLTTPDCLTIADMTKKMVEDGAEYAVFEASSHALSQRRLAAIDFKAAAFTNLSGDHLDYHETAENYLNAKALLFESLAQEATAVLNQDSPEAHKLAEKTAANILWYSLEADAELKADIISMTTEGTDFELAFQGDRVSVHTPLVGRFNVSNCLAAAGLCLAAGLDLSAIASGLENSPQIPGRLEKVPSDKTSVIVDYAHTDDALFNVLRTLKPLCKGKLTVVFGCGGDRDKSKRSRMAAVAEKLADSIFVTSDNPRTESAAAIIGEIVVGFDNPVADSILVEVDREKAIRLAVENAGLDDIVLIAGKGHETYQLIGDQRLDFSDYHIAAKYLKQRK